KECLTASQLEAVKRLYAGPSTSADKRLSLPGVLPGSELLWNEEIWPAWVFEVPFSDVLYQASEWKWKDFDFDRDYRRLGAGALYVHNNPDLRKFNSRGLYTHIRCMPDTGDTEILRPPRTLDP